MAPDISIVRGPCRGCRSRRPSRNRHARDQTLIWSGDRAFLLSS
jgi:hypothetical protein